MLKHMIHGHWVRLRPQVVSSEGLLRQNKLASWSWQCLLSTGWVWSWPRNTLTQSVFLMDSLLVPAWTLFLYSSHFWRVHLLPFFLRVLSFYPSLTALKKDLVWVSGSPSSWLTSFISAFCPPHLREGNTSVKSSLFDYLISAFILMF